MQIVIDISEDVYNYIKANGARIPYYKLTDAIKKGTPLPKGHGRLVDINALTFEVKGSDTILVDAPTVIEADKSESEDKE